MLLGLLRVIRFPEAQHYVYLADALLHGRVDVVPPPESWSDFVFLADGRIYVPLGPLPAILALPGVLIWGFDFNAGLLSYVLTIFNALLLWRILAQIGIHERSQRIWLCLLFVCGTVYFSVMHAASSWFQAHILTVTLMLLAITESVGRRRALVIGVALGGLMLTRTSAFFALPFFVIMLYDGNWRQWVRRMLLLAPGILAASASLMLYNYTRFGTPLESGYGMAKLYDEVLYEARNAGLFSPVHIPKNLYAMLLLAPQPYPSINAPVLEFPYIAPSYWGLGLFWNTPAFLAAFLAPRKDKLVLANWAASFSVALLLCTYYGVGLAQNGYRYALDFMPFLFMNAALVLSQRWGAAARWLIGVSMLVTFWAALFFPAASLFKGV